MMSLVHLRSKAGPNRGRRVDANSPRPRSVSLRAWDGPALLATLALSLALMLWNGLAFAAGERAAHEKSQVRTAAVTSAALTTGEGRAANSTQGAAQFVNRLSTAASATLTDPGLDAERRKRALRALLIRGFDTDTIGRVVLGRYWRTATEAQRQEYRRLFQKFILTTYATRLAKYPNASVSVTSARPGKRNFVIVKSIVRRPGKPPLRVDWLVRHSPEGHRVIDIVVEGISMAITQRAEFAAIIQRNGGDVESLLAALRSRAT